MLWTSPFYGQGPLILGLKTPSHFQEIVRDLDPGKNPMKQRGFHQGHGTHLPSVPRSLSPAWDPINKRFLRAANTRLLAAAQGNILYPLSGHDSTKLCGGNSSSRGTRAPRFSDPAMLGTCQRLHEQVFTPHLNRELLQVTRKHWSNFKCTGIKHCPRVLNIGRHGSLQPMPGTTVNRRISNETHRH